MAIQYPDFRADPNAVPNAGGWQNVISNVQKGYILSQLPSQMKMQKALQQAQLEKAQQDVYYNPQTQESQLALQRAQTEGANLGNQYYVPSMEADLAAKRAQTNYINLQGTLIPSQIALNQAQAAKAGQGDNGITIGTDADGRPIIQIGGSGGAGARNGGRLGTDSQGNVVQEPTQATKTQIQTKTLGETVAAPYIDKMIRTLPQFQTATTRAASSASSLFNQAGLSGWLDKSPSAALLRKAGLNSNLPSQQAAGKASIIAGAEGLMKAAILNGAHANLDEMKQVVVPIPGESPDGYKKRIIDYFNTVTSTGDKVRKLSATGFPTGVTINGQPPLPAQMQSQAQQQVPQPNPDLAHMSDDELNQIANGGR